MNCLHEYGYATVQTTPNGPRFLNAPRDIHIATDLLADASAVEFIESRYVIDGPCPFGAGAVVHGHLRDEIEAQP